MIVMPLRSVPLEMTEQEFRSLGHDLVDRIAAFLGSLRGRPVTPAESPENVRAALDSARGLPELGRDPGALLGDAARLLFEHSLFNGHPRFYGYITSSPAPIGMLADFLASAVNANAGAWKLSPMATEIEAQVVRWLAQFIGYPPGCGGLLVSGGNMANLTCFLAARAAQADWDVRKQGVAAGPRLCVYASVETHTWLQKAADFAGLGTDAIHWIDRLSTDALEARYRQDLEEGYRPFLVIGSAEPCLRARWTRWRIWRRSARRTNFGFTSMARMARSPPPCLGLTPISRGWRWRIPWPWILTNGCTLRSRPDARWSATLRR